MKKKITIADSTSVSSETQHSHDYLHEILHKILLCANQSQPSVDFIIDLTTLVLSFFKCDALELWHKSKSQYIRWRAIREPVRLSRLCDLSLNTLLSITQKGTIIIEDLENSKEPELSNLIIGDLSSSGIKHRFLSMVGIPLKIEDDDIGMLILLYKCKYTFSEKIIKHLKTISKMIAVALAFHKTRLEQRERVKELSCLYNIRKAMSHTNVDSATMLKQIVNYLPSAWQYPEITSALITIDSHNYSTFKEGNICHSMKSEIFVDVKKRGFVEIRYHENKPGLDEGPFLKEERKLINLIADEIVILLKQEEIRINSYHLQEKLRHADRLATIGQMAAGVAHELNEPLGGILGLAQLAKKMPEIPSQLRKDLEKIESVSLYGREVIKKLLQYTRQSSKNQKLTNLNQIIKDDLFFLKARCSKMGIELRLNLETNLPDIVADGTQLNQILTNLIVNSIQAMSDGGILTIETAFDEKYIYLSISDTGIGITEDVIKKIFDTFFTTKDVKNGTGLGLPVVKDIITSYGGSIDITSKEKHGTKCEIKLPISG